MLGSSASTNNGDDDDDDDDDEDGTDVVDELDDEGIVIGVMYVPLIMARSLVTSSNAGTITLPKV